MDNIDFIKKTFENQMSIAVYSVLKFENVSNNRVFKIKTEAQSYIFKIYSSSEWPETGKLPFVTRKLSEHHIPHAKLFVFNREDEHFPNGYLIEECLPGTTADRLALSEGDTLSLFGKLAVLVSRVHRIELTNYGYTGGGTPALWTTFSEFMFDTLKDHTTKLTSNGIIEATELEEINKAIYARLTCCDMFPSVLCHGDLSTKNILVHSDEITLIDWDDAHSLCWVADIARLTFWMRLNYDEHVAYACRKAFLDRYETTHDKNAFYEVEDTLHVWYGLDYLTFFTEGPMRGKIKTLLKESRTKCGM